MNEDFGNLGDAEDLPEDRSLLLVDDDEVFRTRLAKAMTRRGFEVATAQGVAEAMSAASAKPPAFAVFDLKLEDGNGLELVQIFRKMTPDTKIVMLTGYGNIASAVAAMKAGAIDYLAKPVDPDRLEAALLGLPHDGSCAPAEPMSMERARWEHIQRVYDECGRNVSETARRLKMHRRTLQRILAKHAPPE